MPSHARTTLACMESVEAERVYRGWSIYQDRWPAPAWNATGPNYDAWTDDGEWTDNGEKASAATRDALIQEIDCWFEEHE